MVVNLRLSVIALPPDPSAAIATSGSTNWSFPSTLIGAMPSKAWLA
jgi:hypothetical protein